MLAQTPPQEQVSTFKNLNGDERISRYMYEPTILWLIDQLTKVFKLPYLHWEMYGRKARMAETIQKAIEAGGQAPSVASTVKHLKSDIVMKLKARIREKHGKTFQKDEITNSGKKSLWDLVQVEPRFEKQVLPNKSTVA